jgi:hypothetical protein
MKKELNIQNNLPFYEVQGMTFYKFNNRYDIEEFMEINDIEDLTDGEFHIAELLNTYGETFYIYSHTDDCHAFLIADEENQQNYSIEYDYDKEKWYVSSEPQFWGEYYNDTLDWALDAFDIKERTCGPKVFVPLPKEEEVA